MGERLRGRIARILAWQLNDIEWAQHRRIGALVAAEVGGKGGDLILSAFELRIQLARHPLLQLLTVECLARLPQRPQRPARLCRVCAQPAAVGAAHTIDDLGELMAEAHHEFATLVTAADARRAPPRHEPGSSLTAVQLGGTGAFARLEQASELLEHVVEAEIGVGEVRKPSDKPCYEWGVQRGLHRAQGGRAGGVDAAVTLQRRARNLRASGAPATLTRVGAGRGTACSCASARGLARAGS